MYRLKIYFGRKSKLSLTTYRTLEEAEGRRNYLLHIGTGKQRIEIVDSLGGKIK